MTIDGWIYPRQYGGIIFFRGDDRPGLDPWQIDLRTPGFVGFQITDSQNRIVRIEAPIQLNEWQHIAATFGTQGNLKLFVNGEPAAETNTTIRPLGDLEPTQNPALGIGNIGGTAYNEPFHGMIDEMVLYSRALNPRQVRAIYQAGSTGDAASPAGGLTFREVRYDGRLADEEARFTLDVDAAATGESSAPLLQGDVAILPVRLPDALEIVRDGNSYRLVASRRGHFQFKLEVVAKIQRDEPWDEISFTGPSATIASVAAAGRRHEHGSAIARRHVAGGRPDRPGLRFGRGHGRQRLPSGPGSAGEGEPLGHGHPARQPAARHPHQGRRHRLPQTDTLWSGHG